MAETRYAQIYFYDGAETAKIRQDNNQEKLKEDLLEKLDAPDATRVT